MEIKAKDDKGLLIPTEKGRKVLEKDMGKSNSSLMSEMENLLKNQKSESDMEMDEFSGLEELDAMEAGFQLFKNNEFYEVHKDGEVIMSNLTEKPSQYQIEKFYKMSKAEEVTAANLPTIKELTDQMYSWDAFEYRDEEMSVEDFIKFAQSGEIESVFPNFYDYVSEISHESVKTIIKENGLEEELEKLEEEDPEEYNNYVDELRYAVEDKMDFNIEQVIPRPVMIYDPNNMIEIQGPMYADDEYADEEEEVFAEFGRQAGFSDEAIAECYSEATQGGMAKIGVIVDDPEVLKQLIGDQDKEVQITGEPQLVIHNSWNGSGYYVDGPQSYTFRAKVSDILDSFDSGKYSMAEIFGTDQWKAR